MKLKTVALLAGSAMIPAVTAGGLGLRAPRSPSAYLLLAILIAIGLTWLIAGLVRLVGG